MLLVEQICDLSVKITEINQKNGFIGIRTAPAGLFGFYQTARNVYYRLWHFLSYLTVALAGNVLDK
jgi:hypothetical protein